jgi:hypothetical protein
MTDQELKAFKLYGKVPAKNILTKMQKVSGMGRIFRLPFESFQLTPI